MASCILPDWVRCASSTKTNRLPLAREVLRDRGVQLADEVRSRPPSASLLASEPRNLWTSEQISHSADLLSVSIKSTPLLVR